MSENNEDELDPTVLDFLAGGLAPTAPGVSLRDALLGLAGGKERFMPFLDRMMNLFDLSEDAAGGELHSIDSGQDWGDLAPGVRFRDFEGGPAIGDAHGGLVRVEGGSAFPMHGHVGEEHMLVLQGEVEDDAGNRYRAGDTVVSADGTTHELRAVSDEDVIYAARVIALTFEGGDDDDDDLDDLDD